MGAVDEERQGTLAAHIGRGFSLPTRRRAASRLATAVIVTLAVLATALAIRVYFHVTYPYALDTGEGTIISAAWHASEGRPIYNVIERPPFIFTIYTPLFIYMSAAAVKIFGHTPIGPRLLSAAFLAGAAFFIYLFVRRETGSRSAGAVAALFVLVERHFYSRAAYAVTDFPAIFFSLAGLYFWRSGGRSRWWAIALFALAVFSKQISLVAAAAAFSSLFLEGKRRESITLFAVFVALVIAGLGAGRLIHGEAFLVNVIKYTKSATFDPRLALRYATIALALYIVPVAGWLWMLARAPRHRQYLLPALYVLFAVMVGATAGRLGASRSYFFDLGAGLAIVAGYQWAWLEARMAEGRIGKMAGAALALQVALVATGVLYKLPVTGDRTKSDAAHDAAVRAVFTEGPGVIFTREMGHDFGTKATAISNDLFKVMQLMDAGVLPDDLLARFVREKTFTTVIVPDRYVGRAPFDARFMEALEAGYVLARSEQGEGFYVPEEAQ